MLIKKLEARTPNKWEKKSGWKVEEKKMESWWKVEEKKMKRGRKEDENTVQ